MPDGRTIRGESCRAELNRNDPKRSLALMLAPMAVIALSLVARSAVGPFYASFNIDPDYPYLFNALNLVNGYAPGHVHHPGTTVQILGALVVKLVFLITSIGQNVPDLTTDVITRPELYLQGISVILSVLIALALYRLGKAVYHVTRSLALALITQCIPFSSVTMMESFHRVSPEPLLVAVGLFLASTLTPAFFGNDQRLPQPLLFGTTLGFGLVTKLTFAPVVALVFALRGGSDRFRSGIAACVTIIILTIPIWDQLQTVKRWVYGLAIHQGKHGTGDIGVVTSAQLMQNTTELWKNECGIFVLLLVLLISLSLPRRYISISPKVLVASALAVSLQIAAALKHPGARYVIPSLASVGVLIYPAIVWHMRTLVTEHKLRIVIGALGLLMIVVANSLYRYDARVLNKSRQNVIAFPKLIADATQRKCYLIPYNQVPWQTYGLMMGNGYAQRRYTNFLIERYPQYLAYNRKAKGMAGFGDRQAVQEQTRALRAAIRQPWCLIGTDVLPYEGVPDVEEWGYRHPYHLYHLLDKE